MAIRELLREELENSRRMERDYIQALGKLLRGSLVKKLIRGRAYYYLAVREDGRVRFRYLGSKLTAKELAVYSEAMRQRAQYRGLLSQVRKQVKYLEKALRAKTPI